VWYIAIYRVKISAMQIRRISMTAVLVLLFSMVFDVFSQDWPQWRGVNVLEITHEGNAFVTKKLWSNPDLFTEYNTPVLKNGYLYGLSKLNKLFCINVSNGETAWIDDAAYQNFGSIID
jgi:hypothetical protein